MSGIISIKRDGDFWVVNTNDLLDHKSVYYKGTQWESTLYEPCTAAGFQSNGFAKDSTEFLHTENFILVDRNGHIRGIFNGTQAIEADRIIADINDLLKEN